MSAETALDISRLAKPGRFIHVWQNASYAAVRSFSNTWDAQKLGILILIKAVWLYQLKGKGIFLILSTKTAAFALDVNSKYFTR